MKGTECQAPRDPHEGRGSGWPSFDLDLGIYFKASLPQMSYNYTQTLLLEQFMRIKHEAFQLADMGQLVGWLGPVGWSSLYGSLRVLRVPPPHQKHAAEIKW